MLMMITGNQSITAPMTLVPQSARFDGVPAGGTAGEAGGTAGGGEAGGSDGGGGGSEGGGCGGGSEGGGGGGDGGGSEGGGGGAGGSYGGGGAGGSWVLKRFSPRIGFRIVPLATPACRQGRGVVDWLRWGRNVGLVRSGNLGIVLTSPLSVVNYGRGTCQVGCRGWGEEGLERRAR